MLSDMIVAPTEHSSIDLHPPRACLFLHEDIVAKTLQFKRELKEWRLSEVPAFYPVTVHHDVLFLELQCPWIDPRTLTHFRLHCFPYLFP